MKINGQILREQLIYSSSVFISLFLSTYSRGDYSSESTAEYPVSFDPRRVQPAP